MARAKKKAVVEGAAETEDNGRNCIMHTEGDQTMVSVLGMEYEVGDNGEVEVPLALIPEFQAHGFVRGHAKGAE